VCHEGTSVISNLTESSLMCLLARSWKTLHKLFSDVLKRSRKRAVRISVRWLTGKKPKYFCDSSTICFEPVHKNFMNTRVTTKLSECLWRDITGHASVPYNGPKNTKAAKIEIETHFYRGSKFPFSHWLCWSSLQQCCRYRAACDPRYHTKWDNGEGFPLHIGGRVLRRDRGTTTEFF